MRKSRHSFLGYYVVGSAQYVVAHAAWRKSRGKRPAMGYKGILNPAKALAKAERDVRRSKIIWLDNWPKALRDGNTIFETIEQKTLPEFLATIGLEFSDLELPEKSYEELLRKSKIAQGRRWAESLREGNNIQGTIIYKKTLPEFLAENGLKLKDLGIPERSYRQLMKKCRLAEATRWARTLGEGNNIHNMLYEKTLPEFLAEKKLNFSELHTGFGSYEELCAAGAR